MDRLFLTGLVVELRESIVGCLIRSARFDREAALMAIQTSLPRPRTLLVSFAREVAGIHRGEAPPGQRAVPSLKKWFVGSRIVDLKMSSVDRVITLSLEHARLSGRKTRTEAVLEVAGSRVALYVVDGESRSVVEAFTYGPKRLEPGQSYVPCRPPPHASPLAESVAEFDRRLGAGSEDSLLGASGATPLLVSELRWLMEQGGMAASQAFSTVLERLRQPSPTLYVTNQKILLSPISLDSKKGEFCRTFASFNEALTEAVELRTTKHGFERRYRRLASAVEKSLGKAQRLRDKLIEQRERAGAAAVNRRRGEQLLAGLHRARRVRADAVVVPDPFDPTGSEIEIALDPKRNLVSNAERFFRMARRAERAGRSLGQRLDELTRFIHYLQEVELALRDATEEAEIEQLELEAVEQGLDFPAGARTKPVRRSTPTRLAPRSFSTRHGGTILVGRSSRGNESLTFGLARPGDLWFHVAAMPGAHVVLKAGAAVPADEEIEQAASIAAYYSKARQELRVEVMVTERRNVSKLKGAPPGTVTLRRYRTIRVSPKAGVEAEPGTPTEGGFPRG